MTMKHKKHLYQILYPNQALVASQLTPEAFARHYVIGSARHYTGKLLLKKYKFQYYYMEQASGYETKFAYDLHAMNRTNITATTTESSGSGFWWKLLLFVIIVGVIGYFAYRYFVGSGEAQEHFDEDNYRSFPPAQNMVEMKDVTKTDATLKRPVPTPADDNERIPNLMGK